MDKRDKVFFAFLAIAILAGLAFFGLSLKILGEYQTDKALHDDWCPRSTYGVYDPSNTTNSVENKTAPQFFEFKNKTSVKKFCDEVLNH